jgi:hypothetical protein
MKYKGTQIIVMEVTMVFEVPLGFEHLIAKHCDIFEIKEEWFNHDNKGDLKGKYKEIFCEAYMLVILEKNLIIPKRRNWVVSASEGFQDFLHSIA